MTVQWVLIASVLYFELALVFFLCLPFISTKIWHYIFYSRIFKFVVSKANAYFVVSMIILILFFLDSVREMINYSGGNQHKTLEADLHLRVKLFRSQRNYYISGFTVFLSLVIRKLIMLIVVEADLLSETEIAMKRAHSATETFQKLMKKKDEKIDLSKEVKEETIDDLKRVQEALKTAKFDLDCKRKALIDVEEQAKNVSKEYEALMQKHRALQALNNSVSTKED